MRDRRTSVVISASLLAAVALCFLAWAILRAGISATVKIASPDYTHAAATAWHFLVFSLAVAGLTTAFVQIARTLIPFRGGFHYQRLSLWFQQNVEGLLPLSDPQNAELLSRFFGFEDNIPKASTFVERAFEFFEGGQILVETRSLNVLDLYDLPLEQLTAQLSLRIDSALDAPLASFDFLICVFGSQASEQLLQLLRTPSESPVPPFVMAGGSEQYEREVLRKAEARASLSRLGQFKVDAFQIATGGLWRRRLRLWVTAVSLAASFVLTFASTWHSTNDPNERWTLLLSILLYSVFQGFIAAYLAMFFRDLTAIVENKRRRS